MAYTVEFREVVTGETVTTHQELEWRGEGSVFWWTKGNLGCDCNRSAKFWRGKGAALAVVEEHRAPCSLASGVRAYLVRITLPDGTVVLDEFSEEG